MQQCSFLDDSSRFSKLTYGCMILVAFLVANRWLVLATGILASLSAYSFRLNISYQAHISIKRLFREKEIRPLYEEADEVRFSYAMASVLIFIGFLLLQFTRYTAFAWMYLLIVALMLFIACFVGFCLAIMLYVTFKKIFKGRLPSYKRVK